MTGAVQDAEALSVLEICQHMVQKRLQVTCAIVRTELEAASPQKASILVPPGSCSIEAVIGAN